MKKAKELELNYRAYVFLLIKQKIASFALGFLVTAGCAIFFFRGFIISNKAENNHKEILPRTNSLKKYVVKEGEDLWQIAEKNYGSGYNAYDIAKANRLKEPYVLQQGQVLIMPSVAKRSPTQGDITSTAASTSQVTIKGTTYTVQEGDYLFQIAEKAYGDGNLMQKIIDANKIPPPYDIEAGQILMIPR